MLRKLRLAAWCGLATAGGFLTADGLDRVYFARGEQTAHDRRFDEVMALRQVVSDLRLREMDLRHQLDRTGLWAGHLESRLRREGEWLIPAADTDPPGVEIAPADRIPPQSLPTVPVWPPFAPTPNREE